MLCFIGVPTTLCHTLCHTPSLPPHSSLPIPQALLALAPESATIVELDDEGRVVSEQCISSRLVHHGDMLKVCAVL